MIKVLLIFFSFFFFFPFLYSEAAHEQFRCSFTNGDSEGSVGYLLYINKANYLFNSERLWFHICSALFSSMPFSSSALEGSDGLLSPPTPTPRGGGGVPVDYLPPDTPYTAHTHIFTLVPLFVHTPHLASVAWHCGTAGSLAALALMLNANMAPA